MEFVAFQKWLAALSMLLSVITAAWVLRDKSTKSYDDKLAKLDDESGDHDRRIQKIEDLLPHLPSKDAVHNIDLAIARLEGHVAKIEASGAATERTVRRIDDFLSKGGK
jgi:hypothetical protein